MTSPDADGGLGTAAWTPEERETFLAAIERRRRAAWRVSLASGTAAGVLALVMAVLLAPLLWSVLGLALDLVNLVVPMPNLMGQLGVLMDQLTAEGPVPVATIARALVLGAVPGLVLMAVAFLALRRVVLALPLFNAGEVPGRALDGTVLAEQRMQNVVTEMAIAAGIPTPRVLVVRGAENTAAMGRDEAHATLVVGEGLLQALGRDEMQGAIGHVVGSVANGDMVIGMRAAGTMALFGLLARLSASMADRDEWKGTARLVRALVFPTAGGAARLMEELADPFAPEHRPASRRARAESTSTRLTWREWAQMPFMGPVWFSGFMAGLVSTFFLSPLVAVAWRQRKYMADATAVQLTRDPNALAGALRTLGSTGASTRLSAWLAHLAVVASGSARGQGMLGGNLVGVFPSDANRQRALERMGATVRPVTDQGWAAMPLGIRAIVSALFVVVGGLLLVVIVLATWLSAAMSMIFTMAPAAILHLFLRWLAR